MLRRADRDVHVHPSTRLPGAPEIEAAIGVRLAAGELFAACYADLDHFKEYNDRYSYFEGDRVIRILAKILHDVVRGLSPEGGFVGHIGGDDFIFLVPMLQAPEICQEIVSIFDLLVPYQYSEQDRQCGIFFGKDRRGQLHRVPLMTVSIGVVTNERRTLQSSRAGQRAGDRDEELCEDTQRIRLRGRPATGSDPRLARAASPSDEAKHSRVSDAA